MKKYFLFILLLMLLVSNAKAANTYEIISDGYKLKDGSLMKRIMVNNKIAFCIEPGVPVGVSDYKQQEFEKEYQRLNIDLKKDIQKIGLYAKYYYESTNKVSYYYAGQELIWAILGKSNYAFAQDISKEKNEIKNGAASFEKTSKYANQSFKIKGGDTLELKDDFSDFEIDNKNEFEKATGLKVSLNKDKLVIKNDVNNLVNKKVSLKFIKFKQKFSKGVSYAHYNSVSQDYVSVNDNFNISMNIDFESEATLGGFKGSKVNEDNQPLSKVEFTLYQDDKVIKKFESNEKGLFQVDNLKPGKYYLQESKTYENLVLDDKKYEINIQPKQIISINDGKAIVNKFKKGRIIFSKHGQKINEDSLPLKNVVFGIYDSNKKLLQELKSDEEGKLISNYLKYGKYLLKEIETVDDYLIDEEFYDFEISSEKDLIFNEGKPFINKAKEYQFIIKKLDGDNRQPLADVSFNIASESFNQEFNTDEKGEIEINLNKGCYAVKEIKALDGYLKNKDEKEVCLEKDEEVEFLNYKYFQVDTGFKKPNSLMVVVGFGVMTLFLIGRILYTKYKTTRE